jgi:hypothetical protein
MLLGLASVDLSSAEWDSGSAAVLPVSPHPLAAPKPTPTPPTAKPKIRHEQSSSSSSSSSTSPDTIFRSCFERAFSLSSDGVVLKPPVSIVDMSAVNRGYALIASRDIRRGEVIYTEKAAEASQMPRQCLVCSEGDKQKMGYSYQVKGCQNCFQSLEPASSILCCDTAKLPMEEYWPVLLDENEPGPFLRRVRCQNCSALFCSKQCHESHQKKMGSCCRCIDAMQAVVHAYCCHSNSSIDNDEDGADNEATISVEPSLMLASRMFCAEIQRYRGSPGDGIEKSPFIGICGESSDINPLEIGALRRKEDQHEPWYSLEVIYDALCNAFELTETERKAFPLTFYEKYVAMAARNGFNVTTRSPFREYYSAMTRATGGRNSERHKTTVRQLALALGAEDGELRRDMDREIDEKCAIQIAALFSLTARINHSCDPCAELRGGEFIDCHVDLMAKRDISKGEEISISYINLGRTAGRAATDRNKRRRELKARYLFDCDCIKCMEG